MHYIAIKITQITVFYTFATTPGMNRTHNSDMLQRTLP